MKDRKTTTDKHRDETMTVEQQEEKEEEEEEGPHRTCPPLNGEDAREAGRSIVGYIELTSRSTHRARHSSASSAPSPHRHASHPPWSANVATSVGYTPPLLLSLALALRFLSLSLPHSLRLSLRHQKLVGRVS